MSEPEANRDKLPTETEIYILPSGEIVVADLPAELANRLRLRASNAPPPNQHVNDDEHSPNPPG